MFVGHYAASLIAKSFVDTKSEKTSHPTVPLWVFFVAAQLTDIAWGAFLLLGLEHARVVDGAPGFAGLRLEYMPFTHSLLFVFFWAAAVALLVGWRWGVRAAIALSAVVMSHWVLDWVVHRPDLPIYDNRGHVGTGLWDSSPLLALVLEIAVLGFAFWWYQRRADAAPQKSKLWWFAGILVVVQVGMAFSPLSRMWPFSTQSEEAGARLLGALGIGFYLLCAFAVARLERLGGRVKTKSFSSGLLYYSGGGFVVLAMAVLGVGIWSHLENAARRRGPGESTDVPSLAPFTGQEGAGFLNWSLFDDPAANLIAFFGLLTLGISLIGFAEVRGEANASTTSSIVPVRLRWKRFWWAGCDHFATGIRVVFLIPLSLACWLGIIAAFDVVWTKTFDEAGGPLVQSGNLAFLPIALLMGWLLLWPSEPEDDTDKLADVDRRRSLEHFSKLADAVNDAIVVVAKARIEQGVQDPNVRDQVERFTKEQLLTSTFVNRFSKAVFASIVQVGLDAQRGPANAREEIGRAATAEYAAWNKAPTHQPRG